MNRETRANVILGPLAVWAGLMLMLFATMLYAYWPGAPIRPATGILIGVVKALLIAVFFMQLRNAAGLVRLAAIAGLVWASFLYLFSFADFLTR